VSKSDVGGEECGHARGTSLKRQYLHVSLLFSITVEGKCLSPLSFWVALWVVTTMALP